MAQRLTEQVRQMTVDLLTQEWPLHVSGYRYTDEDTSYVVVAAAAQERSIDSDCQQLVDAPSANLVRQYLADRVLTRWELEALEAHCNALLAARLPADLPQHRHRVAIDLHLVPYDGGPLEVAEELRRGEAKAGTTRFHCYAAAYLIRNGRRLHLAVAFVWGVDDVLDVLVDLLAHLRTLKIKIKLLFLERDFADVAALAYLDRQPFTSVVALPTRGERLKALLRGRRSECTTYTMAGAKGRSIILPLWVACRYAAGRRGRDGVEYLLFAAVGRPRCDLPVLRLADECARCFSSETSYRIAHQMRARSTSRDPRLRPLLMSVAWLFGNLWVYLKAQVVAHTARGHQSAARRWLDAKSRLALIRGLLIEVIRARYRVHTELRFPFPLASQIRL